MQVKQEKKGWRDEELSRRHRLYGWATPAVDIDFLMVEYTASTPVALIEYKHKNSRNIHISHPSYLAIRKMADATGIPFWIAYYEEYTWTFLLNPVNKLATAITPKPQLMSELEYVQLLYRLRKADLPDDIAAKLEVVK